MSRRALVAGAIATPFITSTAAGPALGRRGIVSSFERALVDWREARAAFSTPLSDAASAIAINRVDATFEALLRAPARNSGDVATKLDAMLIEYEDSDWDEHRVRIIAADARRLAGGEA